MKPFDLNALLAGEPAETKSGIKVVDYKIFDANHKYPLYVQLANRSVFNYTKDGRYQATKAHDLDLVMSTKTRVIEGWVNVYSCGFGVVYQDQERAEKCGSNAQDYITTIKITHEIEE